MPYIPGLKSWVLMHIFNKLVAIIDLDDPNFDKQKFWQTHIVLIKEYLNGNSSSNTQKGA